MPAEGGRSGPKLGRRQKKFAHDLDRFLGELMLIVHKDFSFGLFWMKGAYDDARFIATPLNFIFDNNTNIEEVYYGHSSDVA